MKKILLMALLLFISSEKTFAQVGSLTVKNHNTTCTICGNLNAEAFAEGDGIRCDMWTFTLCVPPSTTRTFLSPYDFAYGSGPGICTYATTISPTAMSVITDFVWTDISFQWECGDCGGTGGAGAMSEYQNSPACPLFTCLGAPETWTAALGSCTCCATWSSTTPGCVMSNVTIDFW